MRHPSVHGRRSVWTSVGALVAAATLLAGCGTALSGSASLADAVDTSTSSTSTTPSEAPETPASVAVLEADGTITLTAAAGAASDAPTIDIYEDLLCPACADFEARSGDAVATAVSNGELVVSYHFVDFLNQYSASGDYSTRAYTALRVVADIDGAQQDVWADLHMELFRPGTQPAEQGSTDLSDGDLAELALQAGASEAAASIITDGSEQGAAAEATVAQLLQLGDVAEKLNRNPGTPTVLYNGMALDWSQPSWLTDLLDAVKSGDMPEQSQEPSDEPGDAPIDDDPPADDQPGDGEIADAAALSAALAASVDNVSSSTTTLTVGAAGMTMEITMEQTFKDGMVDAFDMQIGSIMGSPGMNARQVDGVAYFGPADALEALGIDAGGKDWIVLDPDSDNPIIASMADDFGEPVVATDPESLDKMVQASIGFNNLGSDPVNGVPATHYELVVGLAELAELMPGTVDPAEIDAAGISQLPIDIWMDSENRLVKLEIDMGAAQSKVTAFISGYNEPLDIQAPDPADIGQP